MIMRHLPNGSRKVANLFLPIRSLSAVTSNPSTTTPSLTDIASNTSTTTPSLTDVASNTSTTTPSLMELHRDTAENISRTMEPFVADMVSHERLLERLEGVSVLPAPTDWLSHIPYTYQTLLDTLQVSTALPWWGVLIGTACMLRCVTTLPTHVALEKTILRRLPLIRLERESFLAKRRGDVVVALKKREEAARYMKQHNVWSSVWCVRYLLPGASLLALNFLAVNGLATVPYTPIIETSFLWLPSLAIADPDRVLSFVNAILVTVIVKRGLESGPDPAQVKWLSTNKKAIALFTFVSIYCQAWLPSCMLLYWTASNATSVLLLAPLLRADWLRTTLGLPTFAERTRLYEELPKIEVESVAMQVANAPDYSVVDVKTKREEELAVLFEEEDFVELETRIEEQERKVETERQALLQDSDFCKDKDKNMTFKERFTEGSLWKTQINVIEEKLDDLDKQDARLYTFHRKRDIALRKTRLEKLLDNESESDLLDNESESDLVAELDVQSKELPDIHARLLDELDVCESELVVNQDAKALEPYERFLRKKELLGLQKKLLQDIEYCERETFHLQKIKQNPRKELPEPHKFEE